MTTLFNFKINENLLWNYFATFLKLGGSILLLPILLLNFNNEQIGIWSIFMAISSLINLLDMGFNPSFIRNISYIDNGAQNLLNTGIVINNDKKEINYRLLFDLINCMKTFYKKLSILVFVILIIVGFFYVKFLIKKMNNDENLELLFTWCVFSVASAYNLYSLYYEAILLGKGLIKDVNKIVSLGYILYLFISYILVIIGLSYFSIIFSQFITTLFVRNLMKRKLKDDEKKFISFSINNEAEKKIFNSISTNAIKIGITTLGGFMVNRSSVLIGSLFLSIEEIGKFGLLNQIIMVINSLCLVYFNANQYIISQKFLNNKKLEVYSMYKKNVKIIFIFYFSFFILLIFFGEFLLKTIGSKIELLNFKFIILYFIISFLERNHSTAANYILINNNVPFFIPSIISGILVIILLFLFFNMTNLGLLSLVIAPGIVQLSYQNWKWPLYLKSFLKRN